MYGRMTCLKLFLNCYIINHLFEMDYNSILNSDFPPILSKSPSPPKMPDRGFESGKFIFVYSSSYTSAMIGNVLQAFGQPQ